MKGFRIQVLSRQDRKRIHKGALYILEKGRFKIEDTYILILTGQFLPVRTILQIGDIWQTAFPEDEPLEPEKRKFYADDVFFILHSRSRKILSVGRLRQVNNISCLGKIYNIQGRNIEAGSWR